MELVPCRGCRRHVVVEETTCPFCNTPRVAGPAPAGPQLLGRVGRAAVFAAGAALVGCATTSPPHPIHVEAPPPPPPPPNDTPPPDDGHFARPPDHVEDQAPDPVPVQTGSISGRVTDGNGRPAASYPVRLSDMRGQIRETTADGTGHYKFDQLAPGTYTVVFEEAEPRRSPNQRRVQLGQNANVQVDGRLTPVVIDRGPCCKPYGAPPARRRFV